MLVTPPCGASSNIALWRAKIKPPVELVVGDLEKTWRKYFMDYIKEAKKLGFSNTAIMDTKKLVFKPEYRKFCKENQCGCYNVNPACPPECGTVETMKQRVFAYEKALILQTIQSKDMDYKMAKLAHNKLTEQLASKIMESGNTDLLIMSAGPYRHYSCLSAYCVDAQEMADAVGMICWGTDDKIRYFSQILFHGNL